MRVLFVCDYGSKKSLMAAAYFNQLAQRRGLDAHAISRGITPDADVPARVRNALREDGIDIGDMSPAPLGDAATDADLLVSFSPEFAAAHTRARSWADVPALSDDFDVARATIQVRVRDLVDELAA